MPHSMETILASLSTFTVNIQHLKLKLKTKSRLTREQNIVEIK